MLAYVHILWCKRALLQVLICLDDFREDNGGTMFMPNSHRDKPLGLEKDHGGTSPGSLVLKAPAGSVLVAHSAWM